MAESQNLRIMELAASLLKLPLFPTYLTSFHDQFSENNRDIQNE